MKMRNGETAKDTARNVCINWKRESKRRRWRERARERERERVIVIKSE